MNKLVRRMTGKSSEMKKARAFTMDDKELEEMYDLKNLPDGIREKTASLLALLRSIRMCNKAKDLGAAVKIIVDSACQILSCDRATVFIVDEVRQELVIKEAVGAEDIRLPWDAGIAGFTYQQNVKVNIPNAYKDERFNAETDKQTGYKTTSILCLPIVDEKGDTIAVLQAINKLQGKKHMEFNEEDELIAEHMALQVGIVLSNHLLSEKTKRAHEQVVSLLQIVRSLHSNMGINSLMFTITERSPSLVDADRCTLYLVDRNRQQLWSLQGAVEVRIPMDKGLAGACATSAKILNIEDAHKDKRFNTEFDKKSGYRTRSVLVCPIKDDPLDGDRQVIGVLQMINKLHGGKFNEKDEELLDSFLDIAGSILATSQLITSTQKKLSEIGKAGDIVHPNAAKGYDERRPGSSKNRPISVDTKTLKSVQSKGRISSMKNRQSARSSAVLTIAEGIEEE